MISCMGLTVAVEEGREIRGKLGFSGQTEPLVVVQSLGVGRARRTSLLLYLGSQEGCSTCGPQAGTLSAGCGLDDDLQAGHAIDGNAIPLPVRNTVEKDKGNYQPRK